MVSALHIFSDFFRIPAEEMQLSLLLGTVLGVTAFGPGANRSISDVQPDISVVYHEATSKG